MTQSDPAAESLAHAFEEHRPRLLLVAYRVLGSRADAEDAVQEAWLRLARQDAATIDSLAGWLTTVVGRICLDMLRSRKAKAETSLESHLPELVVTEDDDALENDALLADSVGVALLVVLETLKPAERLAFVLHDTFAVPFEEIGQIIGRSADATKMLASRARRKVRGIPDRTNRRHEQRAVVRAFLAAARQGDFEALLRVLDPDVVLRAHTARGVIVKIGGTQVAAAAANGTGAAVRTRPVLVNGEPGIMVWDQKGRPRAVMACAVVDGRIVEMLSVIDPEYLATLDLPAFVSDAP